jgi:hypothetical protein
MCAALLNSCASFGLKRAESPVTVSEVIQMSKDHVPDETIIEKIARVGDCVPAEWIAARKAAGPRV